MLCVGVGDAVWSALVELCGAESEGVRTQLSRRRRSWRVTRDAAVFAARESGEEASPDG